MQGTRGPPEYIVLGLDVSTSVIGWAVLDVNAKLGDRPWRMGHIDLTKIKDGFWAKVDTSKKEIESIIDNLEKAGSTITKLYVEDPVKRFRSGASSANTIGLLAKFNCIVSYFARQRLLFDPVYLDATHARTSLGLKLGTKEKCGGKNHKQQVFEQLSESVFKGVSWPVNRNGKIQTYCFDEIDGYVIAMAGLISEDTRDKD